MSKKIDATENPSIATVPAAGRQGMSYFNIAVVSSAGKQGKSTVSRHILRPRLDAVLIAAETLNSGSENANDTINGRDFESLASRMKAREKHIVLDVGASNFERIFVTLAEEIGGLIVRGIDLFVVPFAPTPQLQQDAIITAQKILDVGGKVIFVQNFFEKDAKVDLSAIKNFADENGIQFATPIRHSVAFPLLDNTKWDLVEAAGLDIDDANSDDESKIIARAPVLVRETEKTFNDIIAAAQ